MNGLAPPSPKEAIKFEIFILLNFRTLPALVWHRNDWNMVFPYSHLEDVELNDLQSKRSYIAGFMDPIVEGRTDLYDIFVNGERFV